MVSSLAQALHLSDRNPWLSVLLFAPGMGHAPSLRLFNLCFQGPGFFVRWAKEVLQKNH